MRLKQMAVRCGALMLWAALPHQSQAHAADGQGIGAQLTGRDPFAVSELMLTEAQRQGTGPQFFPSQDPEAVPVLRLKAFIEGHEEQPIALLEVQGHGVYLVRAGDVISLQSGGRNTVLKVQEITNLSVLVQIGTLGQVIVVR